MTTRILSWRAPACLAALAIAAPALAQLQSWTWNADADANWNAAGNWFSTQGGFPDAENAVAFFGNAISTNRSVFLPVNVRVRQVIFKNTQGRNYTLGGPNPQKLLFGASSDNLVQVQAGDTGQHTINGGIRLAGNGLTFDHAGAKQLVVSGVIEQEAGDPRDITITGSGRTVFRGANTYAGDTIISGGRLAVSSNAALGAGAASKVSITGGILETSLLPNIFDPTTITISRPIEIGGASAILRTAPADPQFGGGDLTQEFTGVISGNAPLSLQGVTRLTGTNTFTGQVTVGFSPLFSTIPGLAITSNAALGDPANAVVLQLGVLSFEQPMTCNRPLSGRGFLEARADTEWSGVISGTESFQKTGTKQLTISGDNAAYQGAFSVTSGVLRFTSARAIGAGDNIVLANSGRVLIDSDIRATQSIVIAGSIVSAVPVIEVAAGKTFSVNSVSNSPGGGPFALHKRGAGTLAIRGHTVDPFGSLSVFEGGVNLIGSITTTAGVFVNAGRFDGSGRVRGNGGLEISAGAKVNAKGVPIGGDTGTGEEVGTLAIETICTLQPGALVQVDINRATGVAGAAGGDLPGWDLLDIAGQVVLSSAPGSPIVVQLNTLDLYDAPAPLPDLDFSHPWSWEFARATGGVSGFSPGSCIVDATGFLNDPAGTFTVALRSNSLFIDYAPVPAPGAAVAAGIAALAWSRRRRPRDLQNPSFTITRNPSDE